MKDKHRASSLLFSFLVLFLALNKEQPQPDKELKEHLSHLFLQRGSKCQGIKSSTCSKEIKSSPLLQERQQDRKCSSKALLRLCEDTKLSCCKSAPCIIVSFHVFGREGISGPELEPNAKCSSANYVKRALKSCHNLTETFDKYSG